ncbi:MAG: hypothetical protein H6Q68_2236 [Firmicutes bacterium]|nr:hypothetical protein [Bacillota bacterium]
MNELNPLYWLFSKMFNTRGSIQRMAHSQDNAHGDYQKVTDEIVRLKKILVKV